MTHYQLVQSNIRRSWFIVIGFIAFIVVSITMMAMAFDFDFSLVTIALLGASIGSIFSYYYSDKIVLGISGAKEATREKYFDFYTVTENLCIGLRLPKPKLYVIEDTAINAFATGRDPEHAVICATTGLLSRLDRSEIEGVVAHELAHIRNYDIRLMTLATVMVGLISLIADWMLRYGGLFRGKKKNNKNSSGQIQIIIFIIGIAFALLSPIIAQLIKLALSRNREYLADSSAVAYTKNPNGLVKALMKISQDKEPLEAANKATAHLYFSDPLKNVHPAIGMFASFFRTHPPIEQRIKNLQSI